MPSQQSRDISEEALDSAVPAFPSVFGKSTWEDFTVIPNDGILPETE